MRRLVCLWHEKTGVYALAVDEVAWSGDEVLSRVVARLGGSWN